MITLYTTHCPQCRALQTKLNAVGIDYDIVDDMDELVSMGFSSVPMLDVDGEILGFYDAVQWVNGSRDNG